VGWSWEQLVEVARNAGVPGSHLDIAAAVSLAEHRGNVDPNAVGDVKLQTEKWGPSYGLWQIRSLKPKYLHLEPWRDASRLTDPHFNARAMYRISKGGTNFSPWSTFDDGLYRQYLRGVEMGCSPAPTCRAALTEATRLAPNRSRLSDGICASEAHNRQNPSSDHATGNAWDLTDDPGHGCNAHALVERIRQRQDKRVKYIISNRRICGPGSRGGGWNWKSYSGSNPHVKHAHVSTWASARNATASWFGGTTAGAPASPPPAAPSAAPPYPGYGGRFGGYNRAEFENKVDGNVRTIQERLNLHLKGVGVPQIGTDGRFGRKTEDAVKWFQRNRRGMKVDGVVGAKTWGELWQ
jgi:peptidoglycan hydrolase-like protein with peptidoglycan-binding domain